MKSIKIASGSGFWGDWALAPIHQIEAGEIDYLVLDYLAEVTMSVLAKQLAKDSTQGYARDVLSLVESSAHLLEAKSVKLIANAGGMNPYACAQAINKILAKKNLSLKVAIVQGDNLLPRIEELKKAGESLANLDDNRDFSEIENSLLSANAYIGCLEVSSALAAGADIVITGRVADAALALAPMVHHFNWDMSDWDLLAAGTVAGHILECGAQASGGNDSFGWQNTELANIGYPIVEVNQDGTFEVYKHEKLGGCINRQTITQQLIYEISDPSNYIVPDVIVDFTTLELSEVKPNRVKISKVSGKPKPPSLKVSCSYHSGYMSTSTMLYSWPQAAAKARAADTIFRQRLKLANINPSRIHTEFIGLNACLGRHAPEASPEMAEVQLRIAAHDMSKDTIQKFSRELPPLVLNGPPFATAYAQARGRISEVFAYWPTTVKRSLVQPTWEFIND